MSFSSRFQISLFVIVACFTFFSAVGLLALGEDRSGSSGPAETARRERIAAVTGEVLGGSEIEENLRVLCDEIGGRVAGTETGVQARDFVERLLNRYGLENVHQETFEMPGWERGPFSCEITVPRQRAMHAIAPFDMSARMAEKSVYVAGFIDHVEREGPLIESEAEMVLDLEGHVVKVPPPNPIMRTRSCWGVKSMPSIAKRTYSIGTALGFEIEIVLWLPQFSAPKRRWRISPSSTTRIRSNSERLSKRI